MGDIYHGYVVEDFFEIQNDNTRKALVKNGLVKSHKSGKIINK